MRVLRIAFFYTPQYFERVFTEGVANCKILEISV